MGTAESGFFGQTGNAIQLRACRLKCFLFWLLLLGPSPTDVLAVTRNGMKNSGTYKNGKTEYTHDRGRLFAMKANRYDVMCNKATKEMTAATCVYNFCVLPATAYQFRVRFQGF
jgi:hypothetical protein